jgi:hypothetical protein
MIRLDWFAQSVSGFLTSAPTLQVVCNHASTFASFVGPHLHNPRTVVITSVTMAALLILRKLTSSTDTVIEKPAKNLPAPCAVKEEAIISSDLSSDLANALALHLKQINGDFYAFSNLFDRATLMCVTHPEAREYILKIVEDAVRNKTITYLELRPYLDLKSIAKKNPYTEEMQQLRFLFFSFEGRSASLFEEDRRVFKSETSIYVLWFKILKQPPAPRGRFRTESKFRDLFW